MATIAGVLMHVEGDEVTLGTGSSVLSLRTQDQRVPESLRTGDEVAGWRQGPYVHEVRLARIRTDTGWLVEAAAAGRVRLDTGRRVWELVAWPGLGDGVEPLRVCHDGFLVLWATDGCGEVRLPPGPDPAVTGGLWRKLRARYTALG